ncbi:MAG: competence protein CoiA [Candidatus Thorarchaeota archaeon]
MLYAIMNGVKVRASKSLPRNQQYFCPYKVCDNPMLILKKGEVKIPHFAHLKKPTECQNHGETETGAHLAMKTYFQNALNIADEFMEFSKIPGVRPDIILKNRYAIELQHSPITVSEIKRRNRIYHKNKLVPIWILHARENKPIFEQGYFCKEYSDFKSMFMQNPSDFDFVQLQRKSQADDIYYLTLRNNSNMKNLSLIDIFGHKGDLKRIVKMSSAELFLKKKQGILLYLYFEQDILTKEEKKDNDSLTSFGQELGFYLSYPILKSLPTYNTLFLLWDSIQIEDFREFDAIFTFIRNQYKYPIWKKSFTRGYSFTLPEIPIKVKNQLLNRSRGKCEKCYEELPSRNLVEQNEKLGIIWKGYKCQCGKYTMITGWDVSFKRDLMESFPNLVAEIPVYISRYNSKYMKNEFGNECINCRLRIKNKEISDWILKLKECETIISDLNEDLVIAEFGRLIEKIFYYFIDIKNLNLIIVCPYCYFSSKKRNYDHYKPQLLDLWFGKKNQ